MIVMTIDPGYDDTGVALFHVPDGDNGERLVPDGQTRAEWVYKGLKSSCTISTTPEEASSQRLRRIRTGVKELVGHVPDGVSFRVYVEMPARDGDYGRTGKVNRASVNKLYMAIGVILGTLGEEDVQIVEVKALTSKKEQRHQILELLERTTGKELPRGPRGGPRHDEWDAIMMGVTEI